MRRAMRLNIAALLSQLAPLYNATWHEAVMTATEYIVEVLGGSTIFKGEGVPTSADVRKRIKRGLPYRSLESVRERLRLSLPEAASVLHMPARTLARRKQSHRLDVHESDRLYRLARIAAQAFAVFGTEDKGASWLRRPNRALGGEPPIHLLDTDVGARLVEDTLGRIEHGIVS
jgi:putative toxin-antitoxin system antitoxin component (TIGR02293 family)